MTDNFVPECQRCKGTGHVPTEPGEVGDIKSCPECDGTGEGPEDAREPNSYQYVKGNQ